MFHFLNDTVNFNKRPKVKVLPDGKALSAGKQCTIGDMHGNAFKLLHFLFEQDIFRVDSVDDEEYQELLNLYVNWRSGRGNKKQKLKKFKAFLTKILVTKRSDPQKMASLARFLGDLLTDRGESDFLVLLILKKLKKESKVPFEILFSNHDAMFLSKYEAWKKNKTTRFTVQFEGADKPAKEYKSSQDIDELLDAGIITGNELEEIVETVYKPALKLLSYTLTDILDAQEKPTGKKELVIYSHAPMAFANIRYLAEYFNLPYNDQSAIELAATIDRINDRFAHVVFNDETTKLYDIEVMAKASLGHPIDIKVHPVVGVIMNRVRDTTNSDAYPTKLVNDDRLVMCSGHDYRSLTQPPFFYNLDNQGFKENHPDFRAGRENSPLENPILLAKGKSRVLPEPVYKKIVHHQLLFKKIQKFDYDLPKLTLSEKEKRAWQEAERNLQELADLEKAWQESLAEYQEATSLLFKGSNKQRKKAIGKINLGITTAYQLFEAQFIKLEKQIRENKKAELNQEEISISFKDPVDQLKDLMRDISQEVKKAQNSELNFYPFQNKKTSRLANKIDETLYNLHGAPDVKVRKSESNTQTTIGDMHGNAFKLIHFLMEQGVFQTTDQNYKELFYSYYYWNDEDSKIEKLKEFRNFLKNIAISTVDIPSLLRLIGDVLADRGESDILTLLVLQKLRDANIPFEILLSNHDFEFIALYEKWKENKNTKFFVEGDPLNQFQSIKDIDFLLNNEIITEDELIDLVENTYKPSLKILSYTLEDISTSKKRLSIYSHAPMEFASIEALAIYFSVPYCDDNAVELAKTIDRINDAFAVFVRTDNVNGLVDPEEKYAGYANKKLDVMKAAVESVVFNRYHDADKRPKAYPTHLKNGDQLVNVFGHNPTPKTQIGRFQNLDNTAFHRRNEYIGQESPLYCAKGKSRVLPLPAKSTAVYNSFLPIYAHDGGFQQFKKAKQRFMELNYFFIANPDTAKSLGNCPYTAYTKLNELIDLSEKLRTMWETYIANDIVRFPNASRARSMERINQDLERAFQQYGFELDKLLQIAKENAEKPENLADLFKNRLNEIIDELKDKIRKNSLEIKEEHQQTGLFARFGTKSRLAAGIDKIVAPEQSEKIEVENRKENKNKPIS